MTLSKRATNSVALILAAFFALGAVGMSQAFAANHLSKPAPSAPTFGQDSAEDEEDKEDRHHDQLREQYGEVEQVFMPPLVVTDPASLAGNVPVGGLPDPPRGPDGKLLEPANIDPLQHLPLDPKSISTDQRTAADSFFQMATIAISSMAAGSLALGGFALRRSAKLRKNPNSDFIYK